MRWCKQWLVLGALVLWTPTGTAVAAGEAGRYEGYTVVRVDTRNSTELRQVLEITADVWSETQHVGPMDVMIAPDNLPKLDRLGVPYTVWIHNVQKLIDEQHAVSPRGWFDAYHPYDEIVAYLNDLAMAHPSLATIIEVGTSLEGRPIWGIRIAASDLNPLSPAVVYFSAVHAREWIAPTIQPYLATHLLENYGVLPEITDLVDHVEFILIPVANPDGYIFSWLPGERLWRKNRRDNGDGTFGVDINRNWARGWGGSGSSSWTGGTTYRGPAPFSEPETRVLRDLFIARMNVRAQLDIHSYSQLVLWPWGYQAPLCPDHDTYEDLAEVMQQLIRDVHGIDYEIGAIYSGYDPVSGNSIDWTYGERDIFSYSFELRDTGRYGFLLPAEQIIPNNQEILPALLYLSSTDPVRATQVNFPDGRPDRLIAGRDTMITAAITSGVDTLDPASATLHYRYDPSGPLFETAMVHRDGAAFDGWLPATHCDSLPEYYVSVAGNMGTTTNPPDAPATVHTAFMVSGTIVLDEDLSEDPLWSTDGQWAWGQPEGEGSAHGYPDPTGGHTGDFVYGYNLAGDYENLMPEYALTSPPIDCRGQFGLRVSFWRWLGVERAPYDHASVRVSNDGENWTTVWENTVEVADFIWTAVDLDIAAVADDQPEVYLRWVLGPTDSGWTYCGWNIDDIQIYATGCVGLTGDFNGDGSIDLIDLAAFGACLTGPEAGLAAGCAVFDFHGDGDVDLGDFASFQSAYSGSE